MPRTLILTGTVLLLIGLVLGTILDWFANPEIASDAHVAGVQHGMLLMIIGVSWSYSRLGKIEIICASLIAAGLIGIFLAFVIGAIIGEPYPASSTGTNILFITSSWILISGIAIFISGLVRSNST